MKPDIIFYYGIPIFIIVLGIFLSFGTDAIKDISYLKPKPYSYARAQLMWWTIIILSAFSAYYGYHHKIAELSGYTLALLGIGTGTATLANLIDKNDIASNKPRIQNTNPSKGFLYDILDDGNGISVHRFQALIFNFVFGIIFISKFFHENEIMNFTETQLGLMGISAAAYVAMKANENKTKTP